MSPKHEVAGKHHTCQRHDPCFTTVYSQSSPKCRLWGHCWIFLMLWEYRQKSFAWAIKISDSYTEVTDDGSSSLANPKKCDEWCAAAQASGVFWNSYMYSSVSVFIVPAGQPIRFVYNGMCKPPHMIKSPDIPSCICTWHRSLLNIGKDTTFTAPRVSAQVFNGQGFC